MRSCRQSSRSTRRATRRSCSPCAASLSAAASPMPLEAPVTTAILPCQSIANLLSTDSLAESREEERHHLLVLQVRLAKAQRQLLKVLEIEDVRGDHSQQRGDRQEGGTQDERDAQRNHVVPERHRVARAAVDILRNDAPGKSE